MDFDLDKFAKKHGLCEVTVSALKNEELTTSEALTEFARAFESDVATLRLSVGKKGLLRKAVMSLVAEPVTTKDLKDNKELNRLLAEISSANEVAGLGSILGPVEPKQESQGNPKQSQKTLFIKDYVSCNRTIPPDEDRPVYASQSGEGLYLRSTATNRVKTENVTIAQWVSANMRILSLLLSRGDDILHDYVKYTEEIGELFQIYSTPSVMMYDYRYREKQAAEQFRWGTPDVHLVNFYLRTNVPSATTSRRPPTAPSSLQSSSQLPRDNKGQLLCRDYQQKSGCNRKFCKFSHVCGVDGCRRNHPEYLHSVIDKNSQ